jgi:DNA-binding NarL/FixJ family response regulator
MVLSSNSGSHPTISKLTKQEYIVAKELSTGASNRIIAHRLGLSEKSIKAYLTSIFSKLSVRNRVEAALLLRETICKSSMAA